MTHALTIDASVFVNAVHPTEASSAQSRELLALVHDRAIPLVEPTLLLAEVAAALSRGTGDPRRARAYAGLLAGLPTVTFVPLDRVQADIAAGLAAAHALRGADAVYVAAAERHGARLVTLDREQRTRAPRAVKAATPAEILKTLR